MPSVPLAELARRPLFEPIAPWLEGLAGSRPPPVQVLNGLLPPTGTPCGSGLPIRFVTAEADAMPYEERIFLDGVVPTRPDNWHDFFNALVWLAFPATKAAINARHHQALTAARLKGATQRGAARDGLTQLDESGVIVCTTAAHLAELLRAHRWEELFWGHRAEVQERMRFLVFGHAVFEKLLRPYEGLCAKTLVLTVPDRVLARSSANTLVAYVDGVVARLVGECGAPASPRDLGNLPLLGIPGVIAEAEEVSYYRNTKYFRPRKSE